jgi:hypothetical protein
MHLVGYSSARGAFVRDKAVLVMLDDFQQFSKIVQHIPCVDLCQLTPHAAPVIASSVIGELRMGLPSIPIESCGRGGGGPEPSGAVMSSPCGGPGGELEDIACG